VYLLTSHSTYSSAASFAWTFKYFEMGTIIGEETGGQSVCFGDMIIQKLPNTDLMMGISHKKYYDYGATDENTHGTIPHHQVKSDKAMDYAIDLILNGRQ
jgi:C-terminal processing protease CtpA/Prc